jgi:uncharacterized membrane-anchored protein
MSKVKILTSETFKKDPITIAVNSLNDVLRVFGYKCDGISVRPEGSHKEYLYVIDGFVVTEETYLKLLKEVK